MEDGEHGENIGHGVGLINDDVRQITNHPLKVSGSRPIWPVRGKSPRRSIAAMMRAITLAATNAPGRRYGLWMRSISASALSRMITLMHQGHGGGDAPPQGDGWFALVGAAPAEFLKLLVGEFDVALCSKVRRASAAPARRRSAS
jgi:hypothetical protein